jgi:hypothetical protein
VTTEGFWLDSGLTAEGMLYTAQNSASTADNLGTLLGDEIPADWVTQVPIRLPSQEMSFQQDSASNGLPAHYRPSAASAVALDWENIDSHLTYTPSSPLSSTHTDYTTPVSPSSTFARNDPSNYVFIRNPSFVHSKLTIAIDGFGHNQHSSASQGNITVLCTFDKRATRLRKVSRPSNHGA